MQHSPGIFSSSSQWQLFLEPSSRGGTHRQGPRTLSPAASVAAARGGGRPRVAFPLDTFLSEDGLGCTIQINEKIKLLLKGISTFMSSPTVFIPGICNISQALMYCFYKNKLLVI